MKPTASASAVFICAAATRMNGKFTDMVPVTPGSLTLSLAATHATNRKATNRGVGIDLEPHTIDSLQMMLLAARVVSPHTIESPQIMESLTRQLPPHTIEFPQIIELPQVMLLPQVIDWLFMKPYLPVAVLRYAIGEGAPPLTTSLLFSAE